MAHKEKSVMSVSDYKRISENHQEREYIPIMWIKDGEENNRGIGYCAVPECSSSQWNEIEEAGFILALYIFGKHFVKVKKFIGTKNMNDIQSYYYGEFYKCGAYQRWYECRRLRSKKCSNGIKLLTRSRQQDLLSRLQPKVSEECYSELLQVSQAFLERGMNIEEYVLTLKDLAGMKALVEAVEIGKRKDVTGCTADSTKSTQACPVIWVGKACSRLTPAEIINILTGDFRLSKARSSDIFWEAVWPRLLARGWHSEQRDGGTRASSSNHPVLFLVPGVMKFSRKLVRGKEYFDSICDVLGKVASDPGLIEFETVANNDFTTSKEGNELTNGTNLDIEISRVQPRHCYLKPRTPNGRTDVKQFTVVDTSLGGEKVGELISLPDEVVKASTVECGTDIKDTSEEQRNQADIVNNMCIDSTNASKSAIGKGVASDMNGIESTNLLLPVPATSNDSIVESIPEPVDQSRHQPDTNDKRESRKSTRPTIKVLDALAARLQDRKEQRKRTSRYARIMAGETSHNGVPVPQDFRNEE